MKICHKITQFSQTDILRSQILKTFGIFINLKLSPLLELFCILDKKLHMFSQTVNNALHCRFLPKKDQRLFTIYQKAGSKEGAQTLFILVTMVQRCCFSYLCPEGPSPLQETIPEKPWHESLSGNDSWKSHKPEPLLQVSSSSFFLLFLA